MKRFEVKVTREGKWWMVEIPELNGVTQARRLAEAGQMATEYIALHENLAADDIEVDITAVDVAGLDVSEAGKIVERLRAEAKLIEQLVSQLTADTANKLVGDGIPLRDVAEILGVSHQRVGQITSATHAGALERIAGRDPVLLSDLRALSLDLYHPIDTWRGRINAYLLDLTEDIDPDNVIGFGAHQSDRHAAP